MKGVSTTRRQWGPIVFVYFAIPMMKLRFSLYLYDGFRYGVQVNKCVKRQKKFEMEMFCFKQIKHKEFEPIKIYLPAPSATIGRLQIRSKLYEKVSRRHALVLKRDDGWFIKDISSKHGLYVNGKKMENEVFCPINIGDSIGLGTPSAQDGFVCEFSIKNADCTKVKDEFEVKRKSEQSVNETLNFNPLAMEDIILKSNSTGISGKADYLEIIESDIVSPINVAPMCNIVPNSVPNVLEFPHNTQPSLTLSLDCLNVTPSSDRLPSTIVCEEDLSSLSDAPLTHPSHDSNTLLNCPLQSDQNEMVEDHSFSSAIASISCDQIEKVPVISETFSLAVLRETTDSFQEDKVALPLGKKKTVRKQTKGKSCRLKSISRLSHQKLTDTTNINLVPEKKISKPVKINTVTQKKKTPQRVSNFKANNKVMQTIMHLKSKNLDPDTLNDDNDSGSRSSVSSHNTVIIPTIYKNTEAKHVKSVDDSNSIINSSTKPKVTKTLNVIPKTHNSCSSSVLTRPNTSPNKSKNCKEPNTAKELNTISEKQNFASSLLPATNTTSQIETVSTLLKSSEALNPQKESSIDVSKHKKKAPTIARCSKRSRSDFLTDQSLIPKIPISKKQQQKAKSMHEQFVNLSKKDIKKI